MSDQAQTVVIETPDHIELQFSLAGIGSRFLAYVLDRLIQFGVLFALFSSFLLLLYAVGWASGFVRFLQDLDSYLGLWLVGLGIFLYGILTIGYFILLEYLWNGATPGKRWQDIRVIRSDGRPLTFLDSALRNILRWIDILGELYPIGLVVMFVDSRNRRLGDFAGGTLVVRETSAAAPATQAPSQRWASADMESRKAATAMSKADYLLVMKFLKRREELEASYRLDLTYQIYRRVFGALPQPTPSADQMERELEEIAHLYREKTRIL